MSDVRRTIRSLALLVLLGVGVMAGCADSDSPIAPRSTDTMLAADWTWDACPDWNDACERIGWELWWECPPDGSWKSAGEWNTCRNRMVNRHLRELKKCFSDEERDALRECVLAWTPNQEENLKPERKCRFASE